MLKTTLLIGCLCCSSWVVAADRALLIGIDMYDRDPRIPPLGGTVNDVRSMFQMLTDIAQYQTSEIATLTDAEATYANIIATFESWLINDTRPGDRVFLHYSGHGSQAPDDNGDEQDHLDEVLIPVDAYVDEDNVLRNAIRDDEIGHLLDQLSDRKVTLVIDSCFSGTITRAMGLKPDNGIRTPPALARLALSANVDPAAVEQHRQEPALLNNRPNHVIWTAVSSFQYALEDTTVNPRSGLFSNRFVRGISTPVADLNQDGQTTHLELHRWLTQESENYCAQTQCRLGLTPTLEIERGLQMSSVEQILLGLTATKPPPLDGVAEGGLLTPAPKPDPDNTAGLQIKLEVLPGPNAKLGQAVKFRISSNFDGYLLLLDLNPAQQLTQLFPNPLSERQGKGNRIFSNHPITVPDLTYGFEFTVQEPLGAGTLIALVTSDPVDLSDIASANRGLKPVPETEQTDYLLTIAERLRRPWTGGERNRSVRYAVAEQAYFTAP